MSRLNLNSIFSWIDSHIIDYPTAMNLNYNWSFGSSADFCLLNHKIIALNPIKVLNQEVCFFDLIPWVQKVLI